MAAVHIASLLGCEEGGDLEEIIEISHLHRISAGKKDWDRAGNSWFDVGFTGFSPEHFSMLQHVATKTGSEVGRTST